MRDPKLYLKGILDAAKAIENFLGGMSYEEFVSNDLVASSGLLKPPGHVREHHPGAHTGCALLCTSIAVLGGVAYLTIL